MDNEELRRDINRIMTSVFHLESRNFLVIMLVLFGVITTTLFVCNLAWGDWSIWVLYPGLIIGTLCFCRGFCLFCKNQSKWLDLSLRLLKILPKE